MHVYVQKSARTTLPSRSGAVSGGELSQPVAPSNPGRCPSTGSEPALRRLLNRLTSAEVPRGGRRLHPPPPEALVSFALRRRASQVSPRAGPVTSVSSC